MSVRTTFDGSTAFTLTFSSFPELRAAVEASREELNHVVEWTFYGPEALDPDSEEQQRFALYMVTPRKDYESAEYRTGAFDRSEVERWLMGYVRPRVRRWYDRHADTSEVAALSRPASGDTTETGETKA